MLSPALFGMLPMPEGALLSAPMVDRFGENIDDSKKVIINVWFKHYLVFIYPLGALLPTTKMGYVASPIHPYVSVSIEYFKTNLKNFIQQIFSPP